MANTLLNAGTDAAAALVIAKEGLAHLSNELVMSRLVHREYKREFVKIGDTVTIRKPNKFTVSSGATRVNQDVTETSDTLTIDQRKHVSWKFGTQDMTLTIEDYSTRYLEPAMIALGNDPDAYMLGLYKDLYWKAGTPGTTPNSFTAIAQMAAVLKNHSVPSDNLHMVVDADVEVAVGAAVTALNVPQTADGILRKGRITGRFGGFSSLYFDQNVARHTTGTHTTGSTPLVNGASQTGATLITDGWAVSTAVLTDGDQFTIAGVNSVNPVSKADTGKLQVFTCTAAGTSDGSGDLTIAITPSITVTTAYQTVTASPAENAVITPVGTEATAYPQYMGFHRNALALVTCPLDLPDSVSFKARAQHDGISMRTLKDYDVDADEEIIRMDILYGGKAIYPEIGGRLWG